MLLERLFDNLGIAVEAFSTCGVARGWRLRLPALDWVTLHFVLHGEGALRVGAGVVPPLARHSLAILPPHLPHALECGPEVRAEAAVTGGETSRAALPGHIAGPQDQSELIVACGRIAATYSAGLGLFDRLPEAVVLDFSDSAPMQATFEALLEEHRSLEAGSHVMMAALMNQCLVLVFRRLCGHPDSKLPWFLALEDPRLARALDAILERPEQHHSLESLAELAHMSRSAFAKRYLECFGRTPMDYLREVRLRHGAKLLLRKDLSVEAIATKVGFASRSHFSRAFRDYFGRSPTAFRVGSADAEVLPRIDSSGADLLRSPSPRNGSAS